MRLITSVLLAQLLSTPLVSAAITVNAQNADSLKSAAKTAAASAVNFYNDRASKLIPGKFDGTWWEGGAFFTFLINYWHWTGDDQYNDLVTEGMSWQGGPNNDFFTSNYSSYLVCFCRSWSDQYVILTSPFFACRETTIKNSGL
jgi:mannan endo-1,6-alpha-mannosidase